MRKELSTIPYKDTVPGIESQEECNAANCFEKSSRHIFVPVNENAHIMLSLCEKCIDKFNGTKNKVEKA